MSQGSSHGFCGPGELRQRKSKVGGKKLSINNVTRYLECTNASEPNSLNLKSVVRCYKCSIFRYCHLDTVICF